MSDIDTQLQEEMPHLPPSLPTRYLFWQRFRKNPLAVAGSVLVALLFVISILAPVISRYDPDEIDISNILQSPTLSHPMGTDQLGRDVLSRMFWGSRISLKVGFVSVGISIFIGTLMGALAGFYGGWVEKVVMRLVDIMLCFPSFFLILAVIAILEPSIWNIMAVIGVTSWMGVARFVRAEFLSLKEREFILAAKALGLSDTRIIFRHMLPNALAPVLVSATFGVVSRTD